MVLLVLVALGLMAATALADAVQLMHLARYQEDALRARGLALRGVGLLRDPGDVEWLCLQPPAAARRQRVELPDGRLELVWWSLGGGRIRAQVSAFGLRGGQHRLLGRLRADSVVVDDPALGCPGASRLIPDGPSWLFAHPDG